jgi:hypothetical protein
MARYPVNTPRVQAIKARTAAATKAEQEREEKRLASNAAKRARYHARKARAAKAEATGEAAHLLEPKSFDVNEALLQDVLDRTSTKRKITKPALDMAVDPAGTEFTGSMPVSEVVRLAREAGFKLVVEHIPTDPDRDPSIASTTLQSPDDFAADAFGLAPASPEPVNGKLGPVAETPVWGDTMHFEYVAPVPPTPGFTPMPPSNGLLQFYPPTPDAVGEVRKTSATGGQKGTKEARYSLIPTEPLKQLAILFGRGAKKYSERNWEKGYEWDQSYDALLRHLNAWWGGENVDEETGVSHLINAAWHCFALAEFERKHPDYDTRVTSTASPRMADDGPVAANENSVNDEEQSW